MACEVKFQVGRSELRVEFAFADYVRADWLASRPHENTRNGCTSHVLAFF